MCSASFVIFYTCVEFEWIGMLRRVLTEKRLKSWPNASEQETRSKKAPSHWFLHFYALWYKKLACLKIKVNAFEQHHVDKNGKNRKWRKCVVIGRQGHQLAAEKLECPGSDSWPALFSVALQVYLMHGSLTFWSLVPILQRQVVHGLPGFWGAVGNPGQRIVFFFFFFGLAPLQFGTNSRCLNGSNCFWVKPMISEIGAESKEGRESHNKKTSCSRCLREKKHGPLCWYRGKGRWEDFWIAGPCVHFGQFAIDIAGILFFSLHYVWWPQKWLKWESFFSVGKSSWSRERDFAKRAAGRSQSRACFERHDQ